MSGLDERKHRLAQLIGAWDDAVKAPPTELRKLFKRVVEHEDTTLLEALYACVAHDFRLIPSTPVWRGLRSLNDFELAAMYDRLVLFKKHIFGVPYTHVFTVPAKSAHVKPWSRLLAGVGAVGFTLVTPEETYKIQTSPQSGSHLRRVGSAAESVGAREVAGAAVALVTGTPDVSGTVGEASEIRGDLKIAGAHVQLWQVIVQRLSAGESAPFENRNSAMELLEAARETAN